MIASNTETMGSTALIPPKMWANMYFIKIKLTKV